MLRDVCCPLSIYARTIYPFTPRPPVGRERIMMSPTAEQIHYSTETFNECSRLVHSGRVQAGIKDLLLVRSREAGITERTAALRHQMRERRGQNTRLDAVEAGINAAYRKRWHRLCG